jgi:hypothetical protein
VVQNGSQGRAPRTVQTRLRGCPGPVPGLDGVHDAYVVGVGNTFEPPVRADCHLVRRNVLALPIKCSPSGTTAKLSANPSRDNASRVGAESSSAMGYLVGRCSRETLANVVAILLVYARLERPHPAVCGWARGLSDSPAP